MTFVKLCALIIINTLIIISVCFADDSIISLHYNERTPYLITSEQGVSGLTGTLATLAFNKANIPFVWVKTPPKRQIRIIKNNNNSDCLVGWFKNHEREQFAKYTHSIYQDKPQIALMRADSKIKTGLSIDSILSNQKITLLIKDSYSYGFFLDKKIIQHNPIIYKASVENKQMLDMLYRKRIDYFFIAPGEAEGLIDSSEISKKYFKYITFSDMSDGEKRYILCSHRVEDEIIERLNMAIKNST